MKKTVLLLLLALLHLACGGGKSDVKPEYKSITETVFASGTLEPEGKYNLVAQSDGYLIALNFKEGDVVKKGDVLAIVDNQPNTFSEQSAAELAQIAQSNILPNAPALKQSELNVKLAEEKLKHDEAQFMRYKKLAETNSVSKLELENIELTYTTSKTNLEVQQQNYKLLKQQAEQQFINQSAQNNTANFFSANNKVKAILGGKIYRKWKEAGDYVRRGDVIATIGNETDIYAKLNVDESNIAKIKLGQEVLIQLNTNKEQSLKASVSEIYPAFEEATQSFICKAKFTSALPFSVSGTQLQANIVIGTKAHVLVIPRSYLDYGNKVNVKGKAEAQLVKTGFVSSDWVEITEGLTEENILAPISK